MDFRADKADGAVERLDGAITAMVSRVATGRVPAIQRFRTDAAALRFHLRRSGGAATRPLMLVVLGGTGTGKSTLVNRLLGQVVTATSFRRTFTAGAVAVAAPEGPTIPEQWLGIEHRAAAASAEPGDPPARGQAGQLVVVPLAHALLRQVALVDTPDLDGDQPAHHAEADRAFRWADAVLFLVTPEKYQMTELLPYYRLAHRYAAPALFAMNKAEQQAVVDDYDALLRGQGFDDARSFIVPRDDAAYEPPAGQNLAALRAQIESLALPDAERRAAGLRTRAGDLLGRLGDQILAPLRDDRREADRLVAQLRGMESPVPGVDVNPLTQQLQRRMQQRSVLYLMGPQRILDRVRQAPGLLVRLPRVAWDYVMRGDVSASALLNPSDNAPARAVPDFRAILTDQFAVLQSRLDDALRASSLARGHETDGDQSAPAAAATTTTTAPPYQSAMIDPEQAGRIADEELAELKAWLERRWNATPRDTRVLESLLKYLPGGRQITLWTEAAPYLLVLVVAAATHHLLGGIDVVVLGGWSVATWLTERLSNEVAAHTRRTNQTITDRFARLAHDQIERVARWVDGQAPTTAALEQLERELDAARQSIGLNE